MDVSKITKLLELEKAAAERFAALNTSERAVFEAAFELKKNALHHDLGVPSDKKLTEADRQRGLHSKSAATRKRAQFAENFKHGAAVNDERYNSKNLHVNKSHPDKHLVHVTVSDPNHPMVTKRQDKILRKIRVKAESPGEAQEKARQHYRKQRFRVHETNYVGRGV